jgi:2-dehydro-3-deoxygalactonokinase
MARSIVAIDWGSSALRAALLGEDGRVIEERHSQRGILNVPAGAFSEVLQITCNEWLVDPGTLCLISGMAGSRQGWREAPYCPCPATFDDLAARLAWIEADFTRARIAIVPGMSCERDGVPDVMRGEEVQIFGALSLLGGAGHGQLVLPGTHSKWARVEQGRLLGFTTYMTGEFYSLLRTYSILSRTMPAEDGPLDAQAFTRGVAQAATSGSILRSAFSSRTLALFQRMAPEALASYLSGLLIGEELRAQGVDAADGTIIVIGSQALTLRYELALLSLGIPARRIGSEATWRGLWQLAQKIGDRLG